MAGQCSAVRCSAAVLQFFLLSHGGAGAGAGGGSSKLNVKGNRLSCKLDCLALSSSKKEGEKNENVSCVGAG